MVTGVRVGIAIAALVAGAIALSGCAGAPGPSDAPGANASPVPDASATAPGTEDAAADDAAGEGEAAGETDGTGVAARDEDPFSDDELVAASCVDEQFGLAVEPLPDESGAGQFGFRLVLTNRSDHPCTFDGWPGLVALDAGGAEVGAAAAADRGVASTLVVVQPGGVATAHVRASQAGAYDCAQVDATGLRARLTADGDGPGVDAAYDITVCDGSTSTMTISPLVAG